MARRIVAGAFLAAVMTLSMAGVAGAQASPSPSASTTTTVKATTTTSKTGTTTGTKVAGTARTGTNLTIPLVAGGVLIIAALGMRKLRTM